MKKLKLRADVSTDWVTENPTLLAGEPGLELDTLKIKVGTGSLAWNDLPYWTASPTIKTVSGSTYTLNTSDMGCIILFTNVNGCVVTAPAFTSVPIPPGFICHLVQTQTNPLGKVSLTSELGASIATSNTLTTRTQNSGIMIACTAESQYYLFGDLS